MKTFTEFTNEKLTLNDISKMKHKYNYYPKDKEELKYLLEQLIKERGNEGDFNDIDTSLITDMSFLFADNWRFNGNINNWNTSKVIDMTCMFEDAKSFNQDISNWKVNNVKYKSGIFINCPIKEEYKPKFK